MLHYTTYSAGKFEEIKDSELENMIMKDREEYEDYLVDKAKELLNEQLEAEKAEEQIPDRDRKPEMPEKTSQKDQKVEDEATSEIPFSWDPREVKHLTRNRQKMSNEEMREFLEKDSKLHEKMSEIDEWKGFTRWEERFMVQHHSQMDKEELAEELQRDVKEVELKLHMMGINTWDNQD